MDIAISEFKAKCIQLIKTTAETGEELVITWRGRPLARVVGLPSSRQRVLGGQRDALAHLDNGPEIIHSDFEGDWES